MGSATTTSTDGRLVAFDLRLPSDQYVTEWWDDQHREEYLLDPTVRWPLSVDGLVWPSLFRLGKSAIPMLSTIESRTIDWLDFADEEPSFIGHDLGALRRRAGRRKSLTIGIELFTERLPEGNVIHYFDPVAGQCGIELPEMRPATLPTDREFLGFDVADGGHISALSNCGYNREEREPLRRKWASRLNEYGLLKTLNDANEFRIMSDKRVAEHAPFWIFGISRLLDHESS